MKRKSEVCQEVEPKVASLTSFLQEEILDVNDIDKDVEEFLECYNSFIKFITEIYETNEKTNPAKAAHFILKFKELNRKAQFRLNLSREKTKETKDAINKNHLMMQNLLYEALHLEKETNSCLEYKSLHEDIDLISIEEFLKHAPSETSNSSSEHELTLNRLHWELSERKNLSTQIEEAECAEQRLIEEINKKKIAYSDISAHLKCVLNATETLENIFEMPMHHQENQNEMLESLPESLYVLYTQMKVHADLQEKSMKVTLVDENDCICVLVELSEGTVNLSLLFFWDPILSLLTVQPKVEVTELDLSGLTNCLMDSSTILSELPGDCGSPFDSPWIRSKLENQPTPVPTHGLPYLWCQRLSGSFNDVSVIGNHQTPLTSHEYLHVDSYPRVPPSRTLSQLFDDIRHRLQSRINLVTELSSIISTGTETSNCRTLEWTLSSFSKFKNMSETHSFVSCGLATSQCFFYTAILCSEKFPKVPIIAWIVLPPDYPSHHPFVVLIKPDVVSEDSSYNEETLKHALHLVEVEVNCFSDELPQDQLLMSQLSRLHLAMDLMLEKIHSGEKSRQGQLLIGSKLPSTKRPFKVVK